MAELIASGVTVSTAAYTKTADLITGRKQYVGKGKIVVVARGSAIGMNITVNVGGVAISDDLPIPFFGSTGGLDVRSHIVVEQMIAGGRVEMFLRNTTVGALTTDYAVYFTAM
jgi:hypothetical protein